MPKARYCNGLLMKPYHCAQQQPAPARYRPVVVKLVVALMVAVLERDDVAVVLSEEVTVLAIVADTVLECVLVTVLDADVVWVLVCDGVPVASR